MVLEGWGLPTERWGFTTPDKWGVTEPGPNRAAQRSDSPAAARADAPAANPKTSIAATDPNWPPFGPSQQIMERLQQGYLLSTSELEQLRSNAERAESLEKTNPDFSQAAQRHRMQRAEEARRRPAPTTGSVSVSSSTPRKSVSTPRNASPFGVLSNAFKLDLSKSREKPKLTMREQLKLAGQPRMEIVAMPPNESHVRVSKDWPLDSPLVMSAQLKRGTRFRVLEKKQVPEKGLKRARIVLQGEVLPLGWITMQAEDGECATVRPTHARPLYVVCASPLVRKRFEMSSRAVCMLPVGTKLHLVDSRRTAEGDKRVCVVLLGQDEPLGWITARRSATDWVSIREVDDDDPLLFSPMPSPPASRPGTARKGSPRAKSPRDFERWFPRSPRDQQHANFAASIAEARAKKFGGASPTGSPNTSPPPTARATSPAASPRSPRYRVSMDRLKILAEREEALRRAFEALIDENEGEKKDEDADKKAEDEADKKRKASLAKRERSDEANAPILASSVLEEAVDLCRAQVVEMEDILDPSKKKMEILIGEALQGVKVMQLVQSWGNTESLSLITKITFRQHVRKLLEKVDIVVPITAKQIDALFERLDQDKGGALEINEVKDALKSLQNAAAAAAKDSGGIREKIERILVREALGKEALTATREMEEANAEMERLLSNKTVPAKLGVQMLVKRMKVADVIQKWDPNNEGKLDKTSFRQQVKGLGVDAEGREIEEYYDTLNTEGDKSLSMTIIRETLKTIIDDATARDQSLREIKKNLGELAKSARAAQQAYKKQQRIDDALAAVEGEEAEKIAEERAAREREEEEARRVIREEKARARKAAKAVFDAAVAAKRLAGMVKAHDA